jgi:tripartite-type tricarboxylate transporter receptor subunit TctC
MAPWARAQDAWPARNVRLVVPYPAGGNVDKIARFVSDRLSQSLGQAVFIDNRPGAQTLIGIDFAMRQPSDGYTLLAAANTSFDILPHIRKVPYSFDSFSPVSCMGVFLSLMAVPTESPAKTVREFIDYAKSRPGKLSYASVGQGSFANLAMEAMKYEFGLDILHVPYRGTSDLLTAAIARQVDVVIEPQILPFVRAGKMRAIAAYTPVRHPELPDLPTIAEAGVAHPVAAPDCGLFVPKGTPAAIAERLDAELKKILALPEAAASMRGNSAVPHYEPGADYLARLHSDSIFNEKIIKVAKIRDE